jgi:hypothetical protein
LAGGALYCGFGRGPINISNRANLNHWQRANFDCNIDNRKGENQRKLQPAHGAKDYAACTNLSL